MDFIAFWKQTLHIMATVTFLTDTLDVKQIKVNEHVQYVSKRLKYLANMVSSRIFFQCFSELDIQIRCTDKGFFVLSQLSPT